MFAVFSRKVMGISLLGWVEIVLEVIMLFSYVGLVKFWSVVHV